MSRIIKTELDTKLFLIEYLDEHVGWYYCVQRANSLVELLERLKIERIIFKIKGTI